MPTIQGTDPWEYDVEIDCSSTTYAVNNGDFEILDQCVHDMDELQIPCLQFAISLNATTRGFLLLSPIRLKTRSVGEANWLVRFTGIITRFELEDDQNRIVCMAMGLEMYKKAQVIAHAEFGNTYVEDQAKELSVSTSDIFATLDSSFTLQVPLIKGSIHNGDYSVVAGNGDATLAVYNNGLTDMQQVAIPFYHTGGELYGILLSLNRDANCDQDLLLEIEDVTDISDLSPNGNVYLTAVFSATQWTSAGFYYIEFTGQNRYMTPGTYVVHISQPVQDISSTAISPFWDLRGVLDSYDQIVPALLKTNNGAWTVDQTNFPFFVPDSQASHQLLKYGEDYTVKRIGGVNYAYLENIGDFSKLKKKIINLMFLDSGTCPLSRWSYWKGDLDFSSTIEDMLQDWGLRFYDALDVSVSAPVVAFQGLAIDNKTVWDTLLEFRRYNEIAWRVWEDAAGTQTLEVRDKLQPADWGGKGALWQTARTSKHGDDDSDAGKPYTRITRAKFGAEVESLINTCLLINKNGDVYCDQDPSGDLDVGTPVFGIGFYPGGFAGAGAAAEMITGQLRTTNYFGEIELSDIDMSTSSAVFASCNELVYVVSSNIQRNGAYVPQHISIDYASGGRVRVTLRDKTIKSFVSSFGGSGLVSNSDLKPLFGNFGIEGATGGVKFSYEQLRNGVDPSTLAGGLVMIQGGVFGETYTTGTIYEINFGAGAPAGNSLGDEIAAATCDIYEYSGGGALLCARIDKNAVSNAHYNDNGIAVTEIGLAGDGIDLSAHTIGTARDGGGMDIVEPRLRIYGKDRPVYVFVRMAAAP